MEEFGCQVLGNMTDFGSLLTLAGLSGTTWLMSGNMSADGQTVWN